MVIADKEIYQIRVLDKEGNFLAIIDDDSMVAAAGITLDVAETAIQKGGIDNGRSKQNAQHNIAAGNTGSAELGEG